MWGREEPFIIENLHFVILKDLSFFYFLFLLLQKWTGKMKNGILRVDDNKTDAPPCSWSAAVVPDYIWNNVYKIGRIPCRRGRFCYIAMISVIFTPLWNDWLWSYLCKNKGYFSLVFRGLYSVPRESRSVFGIRSTPAITSTLYWPTCDVFDFRRTPSFLDYEINLFGLVSFIAGALRGRKYDFHVKLVGIINVSFFT